MSSQLMAIETGRPQTPAVNDLKAKLDSVLQEVVGSLAPVWPLKDYVPSIVLGLAHRSFMSARTFLRTSLSVRR